MQKRLHELDHRLIRRFTSRTIHLFTRFLFVAAPEMNKHHQHARFDDIRIDRECFSGRLFCLFVVFRAAKTFEDAIDMRRTEPVMREGKIRIELNRALEMRNRLVAIVI